MAPYTYYSTTNDSTTGCSNYNYYQSYASACISILNFDEIDCKEHHIIPKMKIEKKQNVKMNFKGHYPPVVNRCRSRC